jgi:inhibitor of KinA
MAAPVESPAPRFVYGSDQTLLVCFGNEITPEAHSRVLKLLRVLQAQKIHGIRNLHPAYCSLLIKFDPCRFDHHELIEIVRRHAARLDAIQLPEPRTVAIPVCYGGEFGPDLDSVAERHGITSAEVIRLHSDATYLVYCLGFVPGFAYLGGLPQVLATPRLPVPRRHVEPGSVGIAGTQTGVYPFATPGGWRLIGRTPLRLFRPDRAEMSLLSMGDRVKFRPIAESLYRKLQEGAA